MRRVGYVCRPGVGARAVNPREASGEEEKQVVIKKALLWFGLAVLCAQPALAWRPAGWVYARGPFVYELSSGDWYWMSASGTQWVYGYRPAQGWRTIQRSGLANGWSRYQWPHAIDDESGALFYHKPDGTRWCVNLRTRTWSRFGWAPAVTTRFVERNGVVSMEAENFTSQTGYQLFGSAGSSGGQVMKVVAGSGSLNFEFTVWQGGLWYIWVLTHATHVENNGMYLGLDGGMLSAPSWHPMAGATDIYLKKSGWSWTPLWLKGHSYAGPITADLTPGKHVLSVIKRKMENPLIDKIVLTRINQPPAGLGPAETRP
jgi:hypothetical protein